MSLFRALHKYIHVGMPQIRNPSEIENDEHGERVITAQKT